jgi:hypothetical protein
MLPPLRVGARAGVPSLHVDTRQACGVDLAVGVPTQHVLAWGAHLGM